MLSYYGTLSQTFYDIIIFPVDACLTNLFGTGLCLSLWPSTVIWREGCASTRCFPQLYLIRWGTLVSFFSIPFPTSILVPVDMLTLDCAGQSWFNMMYGKDEISIRPNHICRIVKEVHAIVYRMLVIDLLLHHWSSSVGTQLRNSMWFNARKIPSSSNLYMTWLYLHFLSESMSVSIVWFRWLSSMPLLQLVLVNIQIHHLLPSLCREPSPCQASECCVGYSFNNYSLPWYFLLFPSKSGYTSRYYPGCHKIKHDHEYNLPRLIPISIKSRQTNRDIRSMATYEMRRDPTQSRERDINWEHNLRLFSYGITHSWCVCLILWVQLMRGNHKLRMVK